MPQIQGYLVKPAPDSWSLYFVDDDNNNGDRVANGEVDPSEHRLVLSFWCEAMSHLPQSQKD
jgi:hypothetical protein